MGRVRDGQRGELNLLGTQNQQVEALRLRTGSPAPQPPSPHAAPRNAVLHASVLWPLLWPLLWWHLLTLWKQPLLTALMINKKPDQLLNPDLPTQGEVSHLPTAYKIPDHLPCLGAGRSQVPRGGAEPQVAISLLYIHQGPRSLVIDSYLIYQFLLLSYSVIPNLAA